MGHPQVHLSGFAFGSLGPGTSAVDLGDAFFPVAFPGGRGFSEDDERRLCTKETLAFLRLCFSAMKCFIALPSCRRPSPSTRTFGVCKDCSASSDLSTDARAEAPKCFPSNSASTLRLLPSAAGGLAGLPCCCWCWLSWPRSSGSSGSVTVGSSCASASQVESRSMVLSNSCSLASGIGPSTLPCTVHFSPSPCMVQKSAPSRRALVH
mmetsp:Transcript_48221/g.151458  ORF Transcript_48221/g.151458 Transcript_48221/m.151458 type:complete len:208 (+) Transcript_48221:485-1108(+)